MTRPYVTEFATQERHIHSQVQKAVIVQLKAITKERQNFNTRYASEFRTGLEQHLTPLSFPQVTLTKNKKTRLEIIIGTQFNVT